MGIVEDVVEPEAEGVHLEVAEEVPVVVEEVVEGEAQVVLGEEQRH